jgi:ribosomal-protein-serine acetyltransferase
MLRHPLKLDCHLALIEKRHATAFFAFVEKNRERYRGILHFIEKLGSVKDTEAFIIKGQHAMADGSFCSWGIWEGTRIIGVVSVRDMDEEFRAGEISYCIDHDYEGRGLVSEACGLLIDHVFSEYGLERLGLWCDVRNERSQAIALRFGFTREGMARKSFVADGKFQDCYLWSLLREEWAEGKARTRG